MTILPPTRAGRIRLAILLAIFFGAAAFFRPDRFLAAMFYDKREGDIVFQSLPAGPLTEAIEGISESPWSHCGVLVRERGKWMVAEAISDVHLTPLDQWVMRSRHCRFAAYRVNTMSIEAVPKLRRELDAFMGKPYDYNYAPDDSEIYCSELVFKAFERALGIRVGKWDRLGNLNWKPFEKFIRSMESGGLPLEREMITPVALTRSPLVHAVVR